MNNKLKALMALTVLLGAPAPVAVMNSEMLTVQASEQTVTEHLINGDFSELTQVKEMTDDNKHENINTGFWEYDTRPTGWTFERYSGSNLAREKYAAAMDNGAIKVMVGSQYQTPVSFIRPDERIKTEPGKEYTFSGEYLTQIVKVANGKSRAVNLKVNNYADGELVSPSSEFLLEESDDFTEFSYTFTATGDEIMPIFEFSFINGMYEIKNLSLTSVDEVFVPMEVTGPEEFSVPKGSDKRELMERIESEIEITNTDDYSIYTFMSEVDINTPGEYIATVQVHDKRAESELPENVKHRIVEKKVKIKVYNTMEVTGPDQINVTEGSDLPNIEELLEIKNSENYEIVIDSSNVDTNTPGEYIVKVTVTDTDTNIVVNKEITVIVDMKLIPLEPSTPIEPDIPLTPIEPSTPVAPTVPEVPGEAPVETPTEPVVPIITNVDTDEVIYECDELPQTGVTDIPFTLYGTVTSMLGALVILLKGKR